MCPPNEGSISTRECKFSASRSNVLPPQSSNTGLLSLSGVILYLHHKKISDFVLWQNKACSPTILNYHHFDLLSLTGLS